MNLRSALLTLVLFAAPLVGPLSAWTSESPLTREQPVNAAPYRYSFQIYCNSDAVAYLVKVKAPTRDRESRSLAAIVLRRDVNGWTTVYLDSDAELDLSRISYYIVTELLQGDVTPGISAQ